MVSSEDPNERQNYIQHLDCLSAALKDMSATYQPAEHMSSVLQTVMTDLCTATSSSNRAPLTEPPPTTSPARRHSMFEPSGDESALKRRRQLDGDRSQTRGIQQRKTSDTSDALKFATHRFSRPNSRSRGRSRDVRRNHSILAAPAPAARETTMSTSPSDFPKPLYPHPSAAATNVVDASSPYDMWGPADMQMPTNFDPHYTTTPPQRMQFANAVPPHVNSGAGLASLSLEGGRWPDARNQWYMRAGDDTQQQQVDNLHGYMWEGGPEMDYSNGMGNPGI
jgi:hypothetical protein